MDTEQSEGPLKSVHYISESFCQIACLFKFPCNQVGGHLRVSFGGELDTFGQKFCLELCKIFDDSVVDQGEF